MFRQAIARSLSECQDIRVVAEAGSAEAARVALARHQVELAIINADLPDGAGLGLVEEAKERWPDLKVVMLSDHYDEDLCVDAISVGADGFVVTLSSYEHLVGVVRTVLAGNYSYDPVLCNSIARRYVLRQRMNGGDAGSRCIDLAGLSPREHDVVKLISKGMSNKEIAKELSISVSTAKTHVSRIFKRMGISSRRELLPRFYKLV